MVEDIVPTQDYLAKVNAEREAKQKEMKAEAEQLRDALQNFFESEAPKKSKLKLSLDGIWKQQKKNKQEKIEEILRRVEELWIRKPAVFVQTGSNYEFKYDYSYEDDFNASGLNRALYTFGLIGDKKLEKKIETWNTQEAIFQFIKFFSDKINVDSYLRNMFDKKNPEIVATNYRRMVQMTLVICSILDIKDELFESKKFFQYNEKEVFNIDYNQLNMEEKVAGQLLFNEFKDGYVKEEDLKKLYEEREKGPDGSDYIKYHDFDSVRVKTLPAELQQIMCNEDESKTSSKNKPKNTSKYASKAKSVSRTTSETSKKKSSRPKGKK